MTERKILITGVTDGLGLSLVRQFVCLNHHVCGCGRSKEKIAGLKKEFPQQHFSVVDVSNHEAVTLWSEKVLSEFGCPELLINCAGLGNKPAPLWRVPYPEFANLIAVNVGGVFNVLKSFLPAMIDAGRGIIVNFSSGWGREGAAGFSPYCASKFAVEGLTQALALELPNGLAAISLDPGTINTHMLQESIGQRASLFPSPADWSIKAVPFLLDLSPLDNGKALCIG